MKLIDMNRSLTFALLASSLILTACGKKDPDPVSGDGGQNLCVFGGCNPVTGTPVNDPGNGGVVGGFNRNGSGLPILNPDDPSAPTAWETSRIVSAGKRVTISGTTGGWGTAVHFSSHKVFFNLFRVSSWSSGNCQEVSVNGRKNGSTLYFHQAPAGLYASDGVEAHLVGSQGVSWISTTNGPIFLGFNAPNEAYECAQTGYVNISIN